MSLSAAMWVCEWPSSYFLPLSQTPEVLGTLRVTVHVTGTRYHPPGCEKCIHFMNNSTVSLKKVSPHTNITQMYTCGQYALAALERPHKFSQLLKLCDCSRPGFQSEAMGGEQLLELYNTQWRTFTSHGGGLGPSRIHHIYLTWHAMKGLHQWDHIMAFQVCHSLVVTSPYHGLLWH
jgi:hypothetical protein